MTKKDCTCSKTGEFYEFKNCQTDYFTKVNGKYLVWTENDELHIPSVVETYEGCNAKYFTEMSKTTQDINSQSTFGIFQKTVLPMTLTADV